MKMMLNPKYKKLHRFVERIPYDFESIGTVIHSGRNLIKKTTIEGIEVNVKRYAVPPLINRIVYLFFRLSKGERAYSYPQKLLQEGFETPEPIAYVEEKQMGLIGYSYFVSVQSGYRYNFCQMGNADVQNCKDVIIAFARFTARLHEAGILHLDYSPGNILYDKLEDGYHFSLVDINRMRFGKVGMKRGCANFARLWGQTAFFVLLAQEYARARGMNEEECMRLVLHYRKKFWKRYRRRHYVWFELDI